MSAGEVPAPRKAGRRSLGRSIAIGALAGAIVVMVLLLLVVGPQGLTEGGPGSRARDFVSSKYAKLTVEVDWVVEGSTDYKPAPTVLSWLEGRLGAHLSKPGGIQVAYGNAVPTTNSSYSLSQIRDAEAANRAARTGGDTAAIWILFANRYAQSGSGGSVAGVSYSGSALAVFAATIQAGSSFPTFDQEIEEITALHEVGHLLGLVNLGTPMVSPHEDAGHPGHSSSQSSVMYWAVEGPDLLSMISSGHAPDDFDANDVADLRGIGGK